jgi:Na+-driven multidrug efflux pump
VAEESVRYLYISMASEPFMAWAVIIGGALNGAGDTKGVMRIVLASQWLVRLPMAYLLAVFMEMGPSAVWWSMNASIFVHSVLISIRYFRKGWLTNANREA